MPDLPPQSLAQQTGAPWWKQRATWFYDSLLRGVLTDHWPDDTTSYPLTREWLGRLPLPDGVLVAADPYLMDELQPFAQRLSVEAADVLAVRAIVGPGHDRVAALILSTGLNPVCDWQLATAAGQDPSTLVDDSFFGYGVDAGAGSFGSLEAMAATARVTYADAGMLEDPVSQALLGDGIGTRSAALVIPEPGSLPVAVCSSGWGDGAYPTWLGVDDRGDVVVVVTDFMLTGAPFDVALRST